MTPKTSNKRLEKLIKFADSRAGQLFRDPNKKLEIDESNREVVEDLLDYFIDKSGKLDPTKGVFIFGRVGRGKTLIMRLFSRLHAFRMLPKETAFPVIPMLRVCDQIVSRKNIEEVYYERMEGLLRRSICFDDVGSEGDDNRQVNHFGNKITPFAQLIERMAHEYNRPGGPLWHITSNYDPRVEENNFFERVYGVRTASRVLEMFNIIELGGVDKRR